MTRDEIAKHLREWQEVMQAVEASTDSLMTVVGSCPESPLIAAIHALQGLATRQAAEIIGAVPDWLENWWLEDQFGGKPFKLRFPGEDWRSITTIEELATAIADDDTRAAASIGAKGERTNG